MSLVLLQFAEQRMVVSGEFVLVRLAVICNSCLAFHDF